MRVTNQSLVMSAMRRTNHRLERMNEAQNQLSSGRRIERPSDDPARTVVAMRLRSATRAHDQRERAIEDGRGWVSAADSAMQSAVNNLRRVRDLAVSGAQTLNPQAGEAIANEVAALRNSLEATANRRYMGRSMFAGTAAGDAVAKVAGTWTYTGDAGEVRRRISDNENVKVNVHGDDVFGFAAGDDVFTMLDDLEAALRADDDAGTRASIDRVDVALDRLLGGLSEVGAAMRTLDAADISNRDSRLDVKGQLAIVEDVDLTSAILTQQTEEIAYQASLNALSRVLQPTLADFLR